jgi:hypothetical protein
MTTQITTPSDHNGEPKTLKLEFKKTLKNFKESNGSRRVQDALLMITLTSTEGGTSTPKL